MPVKYSLTSIASARQDWWERHFLIGALIDECQRCLHVVDRMPKVKKNTIMAVCC
jgi:hypothetical protein